MSEASWEEIFDLNDQNSPELGQVRDIMDRFFSTEEGQKILQEGYQNLLDNDLIQPGEKIKVIDGGTNLVIWDYNDPEDYEKMTGLDCIFLDPNGPDQNLMYGEDGEYSVPSMERLVVHEVVAHALSINTDEQSAVEITNKLLPLIEPDCIMRGEYERTVRNPDAIMQELIHKDPDLLNNFEKLSQAIEERYFENGQQDFLPIYRSDHKDQLRQSVEQFPDLKAIENIKDDPDLIIRTQDVSALEPLDTLNFTAQGDPTLLGELKEIGALPNNGIPEPGLGDKGPELGNDQSTAAMMV